MTIRVSLRKKLLSFFYGRTSYPHQDHHRNNPPGFPSYAGNDGSMVLFALIALLLSTTSSLASSSVDFIILSDPGGFTILNKYEQRLSEKEKVRFLPYSPFKIIEKEILLGDGITPALSVTYEGGLYYLQKNEDGTLPQGAGRYKIFSDCRWINDTVSITQSGKVFISAGFTGGSNGTSLRKDQICIRIFKFRDRYYLKQTDLSVFGWSPAGGSSAWKKVTRKESRASTALERSVIKRLRDRMDEANLTYKKYFEGFALITGAEKTVPEWKYTKETDGACWTMKGSAVYAQQLRESTMYLIRDLENVLIGKPFAVNFTGEKIIISHRAPEF